MEQIVLDFEASEILDEDNLEDLRMLKGSKFLSAKFCTYDAIGWLISYEYAEVIDEATYRGFITYQFHKGILTAFESKYRERHFIKEGSEMWQLALSRLPKEPWENGQQVLRRI